MPEPQEVSVHKLIQVKQCHDCIGDSVEVVLERLHPGFRFEVRYCVKP